VGRASSRAAWSAGVLLARTLAPPKYVTDELRGGAQTAAFILIGGFLPKAAKRKKNGGQLALPAV